MTASNDKSLESMETFAISLASVSSQSLMIDAELSTTTVTILDGEFVCRRILIANVTAISSS